MGFGRAASLTAIGDTVNVAARLETLTKDFDVQLVTSTRLAERAGIDLGAFEDRRIEIRGRQRPLRVKLVGDARALPLDVAPVKHLRSPRGTWLAALGRRAPRSGDRDPRSAGRTLGMG